MKSTEKKRRGGLCYLICVAAEQNVAAALDPARFEIEIVHSGRDKSRLAEENGIAKLLSCSSQP